MERNSAIAICLVLAVLGVIGCGSGSRTFGLAAEEWCERWPSAHLEEHCANDIIKQGPKFLEYVEGREQTAAEIAGIRAYVARHK